MKYIPLMNSTRRATVDDEDFERVSRHLWFLHPDGYAVSLRDGEWVEMGAFVLGIAGCDY
jgi:hypothetical protein